MTLNRVVKDVDDEIGPHVDEQEVSIHKSVLQDFRQRGERLQDLWRHLPAGVPIEVGIGRNISSWNSRGVLLDGGEKIGRTDALRIQRVSDPVAEHTFDIMGENLACPGISARHPYSISKSIDGVLQLRRIRSNGEVRKRCQGALAKREIQRNVVLEVP